MVHLGTAGWPKGFENWAGEPKTRSPPAGACAWHLQVHQLYEVWSKLHIPYPVYPWFTWGGMCGRGSMALEGGRFPRSQGAAGAGVSGFGRFFQGQCWRVCMYVCNVCNVMLCYVMICYIMLCYVMLCKVM